MQSDFSAWIALNNSRVIPSFTLTLILLLSFARITVIPLMESGRRQKGKEINYRMNKIIGCWSEYISIIWFILELYFHSIFSAVLFKIIFLLSNNIYICQCFQISLNICSMLLQSTSVRFGLPFPRLFISDIYYKWIIFVCFVCF